MRLWRRFARKTLRRVLSRLGVIIMIILQIGSVVLLKDTPTNAEDPAEKLVVVRHVYFHRSGNLAMFTSYLVPKSQAVCDRPNDDDLGSSACGAHLVCSILSVVCCFSVISPCGCGESLCHNSLIVASTEPTCG